MKSIGYREYINTECCEGSPILEFKGIKVDGDGDSLKSVLGLGCVKSCDYFRFVKGSAYMIEFSDLKRQKSNLEKEYAYAEERMHSGSVEKRIHKTVLGKLKTDNLISDELRSKCLNSLLVLHRLMERNGFFLSERFSGNVIFVVGLCMESPSDAIAFQYLESRLKVNLCSGVVADVRIVPSSYVPRLWVNS